MVLRTQLLHSSNSRITHMLQSHCSPPFTFYLSDLLENSILQQPINYGTSSDLAGCIELDFLLNVDHCQSTIAASSFAKVTWCSQSKGGGFVQLLQVLLSALAFLFAFMRSAACLGLLFVLIVFNSREVKRDLEAERGSSGLSTYCTTMLMQCAQTLADKVKQVSD